MTETYVKFLKTDEEFGGFSNRCGKFPLLINGCRVSTSEHLYQALKFSDQPEIQKAILEWNSPISSKMYAKKLEFRKWIRADWQSVQLEVMAYCLRAKLIWHWVQFGKLLAHSEGKTIYEVSSKKDGYWGVVPRDAGFDGENHLGKLLMELRDEYLGAHNEDLRILTAPAHLRLRFLGVEIQTLDRRSHLSQSGTRTTEQVKYLAA